MEFTILGIMSALSVLVPSIFILALIKGVKTPAFKNLTIMLASFGILHGCYHFLFLINLPIIALPVDLATVLILVLMGLYYTQKTTGSFLAFLALPYVTS